MEDVTNNLYAHAGSTCLLSAYIIFPTEVQDLTMVSDRVFCITRLAKQSSKSIDRQSSSHIFISALCFAVCAQFRFRVIQEHHPYVNENKTCILWVIFFKKTKLHYSKSREMIFLTFLFKIINSKMYWSEVMEYQQRPRGLFGTSFVMSMCKC